MLLVLKIPVVYLGAVVWWAIRAEPDHAGHGGEGAGVPASLGPCGWDDWRKRRPSRPPARPRKGLGPLPVLRRRLAAGPEGSR
jgi:hypothetical protein